MKITKNEKGSTLIIVLLTIVITMIFASVLISGVLNTRVQSNKIEAKMQATDLANMGIIYAENLLNQSKENLLSLYAEDNEISYPEEITQFCYDIVAENVPPHIKHFDSYRFEVTYSCNETIIKISSNGYSNNERTTLEKLFPLQYTPPDNGSTTCYLIEETKQPIPDVLHGNLIIGGDYQIISPNVMKIEDIQNAISNYKTELVNEIDHKISSFLGDPNKLNTNCIDVACINDLINNSESNPTIINVTADRLNINSNVTIGSEDKEVILIANEIVASNPDITMYGTLIVRGDVTTQNHFSFNKNVTISNSNFWVQGHLDFRTGAEINVGSTLYAEQLSATNNPVIKADRILVKNSFIVETQPSITAESEMVVGTFNAENVTTLNVNAGDLFVENDFSAGTHLNVKTGGLIAIGGDVETHHNQNQYEFITSTTGETKININGSVDGSCS